jgi:cytidylate kinase
MGRLKEKTRLFVVFKEIKMKIALDGPSGAGKSTVAKALAKKLGIIYVDTGALYRTVGLYVRNQGVDKDDEEKVIALLPEINLGMEFINGEQIVTLNGVNVGDTIRTGEIAMYASRVSAIPEVRTFLLETQRKIARENSVVMDGRDIGTVILPQAEIKIFLTASSEARAKRRYEELISKGHTVTYEQVYCEMVERDKNDSTRDIAPCKPADDAIMLDNSDMTAEQTVDAVISIVNNYKKKHKKNGYMRAHSVLAGFIRFFYGVKRHGLENIPKEGGYIICSNHIAVRDVLLIAASCPRQIRFIAKKELFSIPVLRRIISWLGAIKLDRSGNDLSAIKKSIEMINLGELVAIFPQGHRYPGVNPAETPRKNGAGLISYRAGCDVIPVCIRVRKNKYSIFRKVHVIFGRPIDNKALNYKNGGNEEYKNATDVIFNEIISLYNVGDTRLK